MCEWGTTKVIKIWNSKLKEARLVGIDSCIADFILMLNHNGHETIASCCGHGKETPYIILRDNTWVMFLDRETALKICNQFPPINDNPQEK